VVAKL